MPTSWNWKTIFNDFAASFYESRKDAASPVKPAAIGSKALLIVILAGFFVFIIFCMLLLVLYKWVSKRRRQEEKQIEKKDEILVNSSSSQDEATPPRHLDLMRTDSADSSISEFIRDPLYPSTPLSPLSEEDEGSRFPFEGGRLEFSICYDTESECLKATIVQAHGLPQRHCIFYVEGLLLPDRDFKQKTSIRYHNPSPIFEEVLSFGLPLMELFERTLYFRVFELDTFSQETMIGKVLHSFDLEASNYLKPLKMDLELSASLPHDRVDQEPTGEVLVSLCYLPTSGRLTLVILKCRLFQASNGLPSPFLKVSLVLNRKQVKKIKTSIKRKTLNAVYNEAFIFDVPAQHIGNVGLYARVVNDRDEQFLMGRVVIGPQARTSMGVHHWECMLLSPRKPIAQWHSIMSYQK